MRSAGVQTEAVDEEINGSNGIAHCGEACGDHLCANIFVGSNILFE